MSPDARAQLQALREAFLQELPARLAALRAAWGEPEEARAAALRFQAHRLAGAAGTFGLPEVSVAARELEDLLKSAEPGGPDPAQVESALARVEARAREPLSKVEAAGAGEDLPKKAAPSGAFALISGEPDLARSLQAALAALGHNLATQTAEETLSADLHRHAPEVLIVAADLSKGPLPWGAVLASLPAPPALLFASAIDDSAARLRAVREGGEGFFRLPEDAQTLADHLDALRLHQSEEPFRVVVVEDDPLVLKEHTLILEAAGMAVSPATDAAATLEACLSSAPDLVLLDWHLESCTGPEIAAMLRQVNALVGVPIVFLSGERNLSRQMSALHRGADNFLTKPIAPSHLVAALTAQARRGRVLRGFMSRDGLTGLLNHSALEQRLEEEVSRARRQKAPLSFVMMDLDRFKKVNDTHGHGMGDRVLKGLCRVLSQRLRRSDIVGRYGGEEFAAVLPETPPEEAVRVMEGVLADFRELMFGAGPERFSCSFSAGIAGFPAERDPAALRAASDQALYRAKAQGRSRVVLAGGVE